MDFYVNGEKIDIQLENEKTVGDILGAFEEECLNNHATTVQVILNNKNIPANEFKTITQTPIDPMMKLEFSVITESEIKETFHVLSDELLKTADMLEQISSDFQSGKDKEACSIIDNLANQINIFCKNIQFASLFPESFDDMKINQKNITEFFSEFTPILSDFKNALENKDTVLAGDLAEYEISPRIRLIAKTVGK